MPISANKLLVSVVILTVFLIFVHYTLFRSNPLTGSACESNASKYVGVPNELDGCYHIYLDVGSNIGNQVRKLYEPNYFVNASILPIFDQYFGHTDQRKQPGTVCAVGFEPNPNHEPILKDVQAAYRSCGWQTTFFTKTAAAEKFGEATFFSDKLYGLMEYGGSIVEGGTGIEATEVIRLMRLSDYILYTVLTRKLPRSSSQKPSIVMKLDIEGSELEVLTDLIVTGALQHIDKAIVEYHPNSFQSNEVRKNQILSLQKAVETLTDLSNRLQLDARFNLQVFDDETYLKSKEPLPKC